MSPVLLAAAAPLLRIVSGTPQQAHAYAAVAAPEYQTTFPQPLVVRIAGPLGADGRVRFVCVTPHCRLAKSEQPDNVSRIDPRSYDVKPVKGRAEIRLVLATDEPGAYVVLAIPYAGSRRLRAAPARFVLDAR